MIASNLLSVGLIALLSENDSLTKDILRVFYESYLSNGLSPQEWAALFTNQA